jgi:hypothetical protein
MPNVKMVITEESWANMPEEERSWLTYNTIQSMDKRIAKLEKGGVINKTLTFAGGMIGGIAFWVGMKIWGH